MNVTKAVVPIQSTSFFVRPDFIVPSIRTTSNDVW